MTSPLFEAPVALGLALGSLLDERVPVLEGSSVPLTAADWLLFAMSPPETPPSSAQTRQRATIPATPRPCFLCFSRLRTLGAAPPGT